MGNLVRVAESSDTAPPWSDRQRAFVELWSFRCEACRTVAPDIATLATECPQDVDVFKVNVDDCPRYASLLGISAIPALVELRAGTIRQVWLGTWTLDEIRRSTSGDDPPDRRETRGTLLPIRTARAVGREAGARRAGDALQQLDRVLDAAETADTPRWRGWEAMHEQMLAALRMGHLQGFQTSPAIAPQICGGGGETYLDRLERRCGRDAMDFFLATYQETLCGDPRDLVSVRGTPITRTAMRHLYHLAILHRFCRAYYGEKITIVEIGGGFGNLARLCLQYHVAKRYVIVDFPVVHAIQRYFAGEFIPDDRIKWWENDSAPDISPPALDLLRPGDVGRFARTVEGPLLLVSTMALTEIPNEGQRRYLDAIPADSYYVFGQRVTNALPGAAPVDEAGSLANSSLFAQLATLCHVVEWECGDYYGEFLGIRSAQAGLQRS